MQPAVSKSAIPSAAIPSVFFHNEPGPMPMAWEDVWPNASRIRKLEWSVTTAADFNGVLLGLQRSTWFQLRTLNINVPPSDLTEPLSLDSRCFPALVILVLSGVPIILTNSFPRLHVLSLSHYPPRRYAPSFGDFATWLSAVGSQSLANLHLKNYLSMSTEDQAAAPVVPRIHLPNLKELCLVDVPQKAAKFLFYLSHIPQITTIGHEYHYAIPDNVDPFAAILPPHAFLSGLDGFDAATVSIEGPYSIAVIFSTGPLERMLRLQVKGPGINWSHPNGEGDAYLRRLLAHTTAASRRLASLPVKHLHCISAPSDAMGRLDHVPERTWTTVLAAVDNPKLELLNIADLTETGEMARKLLRAFRVTGSTPVHPGNASGSNGPSHGGRTATAVAPSVRKLRLYTKAWTHEGMVTLAAACAAMRVHGGAMLEEVCLVSDAEPDRRSGRARAACGLLGQWVKDGKVLLDTRKQS